MTIELDQTKGQTKGTPESDFYAKAYALSNDLVLLVDPADFRLIYANPRVQQETGYSPEELKGLSFLELFAPSERPGLLSLVQNTLEWKRAVDLKKVLRRKSGEVIEVETATLLVEYDEKSAVFCNVRKAESKAQVVFEQGAPVAVDAEGHVWVSLAKLDALEKKVFSKRDTIPTAAVKKALGWLVQAPVQSLFERLKRKNPNIPFVLVPTALTEVDARYFDPIDEMVKRSLEVGSVCQGVSISAQAQSCATVFEFVFQGLDINIAEFQAIKEKFESLLNAKISVSQQQVTDSSTAAVTATTRLNVTILPQELLTGSPIHFGFFVDPERRALAERTFSIQVEPIRGLDHFPKNRPVLTDLQGLEGIQKRISDIDLPSKLILVQSTDGEKYPVEVIQKLWIDKRLRHLLFSSSEGRGQESVQSFLKATTQKFRNKALWGLEPYLKAGTELCSKQLSKYSDSTQILEDLEGLARMSGASEDMQRVVCCAQEMIENAIFDAPRDALGEKKYKLERDQPEDLIIKPYEAIQVVYGTDGDTLGVAVRDPFGALTFDSILKSVDKRGGFYQLFEMSDGLVITVRPGVKTEVICLFSSRSTKCFSYLESQE